MLQRKTNQGAWEFTDTDRSGYLVTRQYMGYSKREALRLFRQEFKINPLRESRTDRTQKKEEEK